MENYNRFYFISTLCALLSVVSCESQKRYASPPGYDLNKPVTWKMPMVLNEISGIAFNKGVYDTLYAEQDEDGKVFHFKLEITSCKQPGLARKVILKILLSAKTM